MLLKLDLTPRRDSTTDISSQKKTINMAERERESIDHKMMACRVRTYGRSKGMGMLNFKFYGQ
jgi:hypothetical protein